jgi:hypothetical protein
MSHRCTGGVAVALRLLSILLVAPLLAALPAAPVHAATTTVSNPFMAANAATGSSPVVQFPTGTQTVYFQYTVVTPSTSDTGEVVVYSQAGAAPGTLGAPVASAHVFFGNTTSLTIALQPTGSTSWADGGYCTVLYIDTVAVTVQSAMPLSWAVGSGSPPICENPAAPWVAYPASIANGWNLLDIPVSGNAVTSAATLVSNMNQSNQLGAGAVTLLATYYNGTFHIYVPGYAADQQIQSNQGAFVLSSKQGTWTPEGNPYFAGIPTQIGPGWNLVAAPFPGNQKADAIMSEINGQESPGGTVSEEAMYSPTGYVTYTSNGSGNDFTLPPTSGVWVLSTGTSTWTPS